MPSQNTSLNSASAFINAVHVQSVVNSNNISSVQNTLNACSFIPIVQSGSVGISTIIPTANLHITSQSLISFSGTVRCVVGSDVGRQDNIQIRNDVSGDLNNKYWYVYSGNSRTAYYVWYNVAGAGVDPIPPAPFGVNSVISLEVPINTNDTNVLVAQATSSVLSTLTGVFSIIYMGTHEIFVTRVAGGITRAPFDGNIGGSWGTLTAVFGSSGSDILSNAAASFATLNRLDAVSINGITYTITHINNNFEMVLDRPLPASVNTQTIFLDNSLLKLDRSNNINLLTVDKSGHVILSRLVETSYSNDAAAATGNVPVGGLYRAAVGHPTVSENSITIRLL